MRTELVAVDRRAALRAAARAWHRSGAIDEVARDAVEQHYGDDWRRSGWIFRLLLGLFTLIAVLGFLGFWLALVEPESEAVLGLTAAFAGFALAVATELLQGRARLRRVGVEEACALLAVGGLVGGLLFTWIAMAKPGDELAFTVGLALTALATALAAWRWGMPVFAAVAAVALLGLLTRFPAARWSWLALGLVLQRPLLAASADAARPRALRAAWAWAWAVLAGGVFAAVFLPGWDGAWIEHFSQRSAAAPPDLGLARAAAAVAMVGWPAWLVLAGVRQRRPMALRIGALLMLVALAVLVDEMALDPLWLRGVLGGLVLLVVGLGLRRWLARGAGGERRGITGEPPAAPGGAAQTVEIVAALAALTPAPRDTTTEPPGLAGQGGEFGGGGASGRF